MPTKRKSHAAPRRHFKSDAEARAALTALAEKLDHHNFFWPAGAIREFLKGNSRSLDEAFGLVPPKRRGRPRTRGTAADSAINERIARAIFEMRSMPDPVPWDRIADAFPSRDAEWLKNLYSDWKVRLLAERLDESFMDTDYRDHQGRNLT
jgi:hypothetical protein